MTRFWISVAVLVAAAGPAMAGGRCVQPYAPVIKVGAATSEQELATLREDVRSFMAASDIYQECILARGVGSDPRISANQAQKIRVGQQFNEIIRAHKKGRPS